MGHAVLMTQWINKNEQRVRGPVNWECRRQASDLPCWQSWPEKP